MKKYRTSKIYGDFYENKQRPLVVVIGGSRAGLPVNISDKLFDYLKSNFNVLLLAYFGKEGLNESLERIPMEYFINSIEFIIKEYGLDDEKIIIIGQSKGGEAALLLTNYINSAATIALVASCYVFQGLPKKFDLESFKEPKSSWSYNGKELPYIKFQFNKDILKDSINGNFCSCYEKSIKNNFNEEAYIDINNYKGKVFLISEGNDKYWPSKEMSQIIFDNSYNKCDLKYVSMDLPGHYLLKYDESVDEIIKYLNTFI